MHTGLKIKQASITSNLQVYLGGLIMSTTVVHYKHKITLILHQLTSSRSYIDVLVFAKQIASEKVGSLYLH